MVDGIALSDAFYKSKKKSHLHYTSETSLTYSKTVLLNYNFLSCNS
ncbi:MAG: hypothetical protein ACI86M_003746, partial [Saprospiraceae bacterium]